MESFRLRQMLYRKMMVRPNFIKNVLYVFIYCMSARIAIFISGIILPSWQFFMKKWSPFVGNNCHVEKMILNNEAKPHYRMCCNVFTKYIFFARLLLPIWRNIKQVFFQEVFNVHWSLHLHLFDNNRKCRSPDPASCVGIWYFERHNV